MLIWNIIILIKFSRTGVFQIQVLSPKIEIGSLSGNHSLSCIEKRTFWQHQLPQIIIKIVKILEWLTEINHLVIFQEISPDFLQKFDRGIFGVQHFGEQILQINFVRNRTDWRRGCYFLFTLRNDCWTRLFFIFCHIWWIFKVECMISMILCHAIREKQKLQLV